MKKSTEYCDLVMKGGITSGLVYPRAALALSERYRFKNIGGTSAGAIAAVACAAASLGERRKELNPAALKTDPASAGLAGLRTISDDLCEAGFIYRLFQPARGARTAYWLIVRLAADPPVLLKFFLVLVAIIGAAGIELAFALAVLTGLAYWIGGTAGAWAALVPAMLCAFAFAAICAAFRTARTVRRNRMGICPGLPQRRFARRKNEALTDWLYGVVQTLAGQKQDNPLLFDDLWSAPRYPGEPAGERTMTLQMITTGVSHHEPRSLPFDGGKFWFLREDFDALFPKHVVDWMAARDKKPIKRDGKTYFALPQEGALPVIVAARMSLSFPILISAIPLYEQDYSGRSKKNAAAPDPVAAVSAPVVTAGKKPPVVYPLRICWFSDGGVSSNFPIHLFDAPLPRWPTFAINLVYPETVDGNATKIFLPKANNQGWQRRYAAIADRSAMKEVGGFLFAIMGTMQNWRDLLLSRAPGQRDRIVHIPLDKTEGGMNLNMPDTVLRAISDKGEAAGRKLVADFGFNNHYWLRWRNVAAAMERFTIGFAVGAGPPISVSYEKAHASAATGAPPQRSYPLLSKAERDESTGRFAAMTAQGLSWGTTHPSLIGNAPKPVARIQLTPLY